MKSKNYFLTPVFAFVAIATSFGQPTITVQPKSLTASLFANPTFRVTASSTQALSFQWRFNALPIDGAITNSLTITNVQKDNAGPFDVVASDPSGSVTSKVATLTITPFNSIYCFGYSWTATHLNCLFTSDSTRYYHNRACNGPLWPELLSTNIGLAYVDANNYAQCGAGALDVLNQAIQFRVPPQPQLSLYFLMFSDDILRGLPPGGSDYLNVTNEVAWNQVIQTGILNNSNAVSRLYARGARAIVVQSEIDGGAFPGALVGFGNNTVGLSKFGEYCERYNVGFSNAVNSFSRTKPDVRIVWVDMFSKLNDVIANPTGYGFTKTTVDALGDTNLTNKSFTGPGADYVFWDQFHGTTKLHEFMTAWNLEALTNSVLEKLDVTITGGSPIIQMNHLLIGRDYTLQSSTNLSYWQEIYPFTAVAGTNQWSGAADAAPTAFYRLKWQPRLTEATTSP